MSQREEKISKLLEFPYDAFLMIRLEYVQILDDELEAKLLRIIEKYVEQERKNLYQKMLNVAGTPPNEKVDITRDIWVPISYRLFMNDLFGTVTSENTVKKALKRMVDKKIIFQRFEPKKKYDAPEYKIRIDVLQMLLTVLKNPGYQSLIPSIVDTLKSLPPQAVIPSEYQQLIPSTEKSSSNQNLRVSTNGTTITEGYDNNITSITERDTFASAHVSLAHDLETVVDEENPTKYDLPAIKLNGATPASLQAVQNGATDATSTTDRQHPHPPGRSMDRLPVEETPVAIASTPDGAVAPPTAAVRQSYTSSARVASSAPTGTPKGHERNDGATTESGGESRPSDSSHSAVSEQASQASLQQQAASAQAQNGAGTRQEKPLSLKEDEPTVRPETPAQRKRRIEAREKEIWALVEAGLRTKFTRTHRQLKANTAGMERLIEDETNDETIKTALDRLSDFWKNQFDLAMFHAKLPGLVRKQTRRLADKSPQNVLDAQYEAALQKTGQSLDDSERHSEFDIYVGNGPEARRKLVEDGMKLVAQGKYTDM